MAEYLPGRAQLQQDFYASFHQQVETLQSNINRLGQIGVVGGEQADAIDRCLNEIARLSDAVKDASIYLPPYDQRSYSETIKALSVKLEQTRAHVAPKPKFSFKTARKNVSAVTVADGAHGNRPRQDSSTASSLAPSQAPTPPPDSTTPAQTNRLAATSGQQGVSIRGLSLQHVILASPSSISNARSAAISAMQECVVTPCVSGSRVQSLSSLTFRNISNSLLVCGKVDGPIHLTGLNETTIVAVCRQFRMHNSTNCRIYLHCSSNPIIENCDGLGFAPLPETFTVDWSPASDNQWDRVDDFNWLKAEQSPHWQNLAESDLVSESIWAEVTSGSKGKGVRDILRSAQVQRA